MGSMTSGTKAPPSPQIVYVPAPVVAPVAEKTATETPAQPSAQEKAAQAREQSLLTRSRGHLGTIATSFRGFLGQGASSAPRKTLLGE